MNALEVIKIVARDCGISVEQILSGERGTASVVEARWIAMYLCRVILELSFPEIARVFKKKDHTTAIAGVRAIRSQWAKHEPRIDRLTQLIYGGLLSSGNRCHACGQLVGEQKKQFDALHAQIAELTTRLKELERLA